MSMAGARATQANDSKTSPAMHRVTLTLFVMLLLPAIDDMSLADSGHSINSENRSETALDMQLLTPRRHSGEIVGSKRSLF
jgi:hypothetical protein